MAPLLSNQSSRRFALWGMVFTLTLLSGCVRVGFDEPPTREDIGAPVDAPSVEDAASDDGSAVRVDVDIPDVEACEAGDCPSLGLPCALNLCVAGVCTVLVRPKGADCSLPQECKAGTCEAGLCKPDGALDCKDPFGCTTDLCEPGQGCVHVAKDCDDGDACTSDLCVPWTGECASIPSPDCNCTHDSDCPLLDDPSCAKMNCVAQQCVLEPKKEGKVCNDGDPCTSDDVCDNGSCEGTPKCDETEGKCETEVCLAGTCLTWVKPCDDGSVCTVDACEGGLCAYTAVGPAECNDDDPCTSDSCDKDEGCQHVWVTALGDGTLCECQSDADCLQITPQTVCSSVACVESQCFLLPHLDGTPCEEDGPCGGAGECSGGTCKIGDLCDDGNPCTINACLLGPDGPACIHPDACDDGNLCTKDGCDADGGCKNDDVVCEDDESCTMSFCDPQSGDCAHIFGGCELCYKDSDCASPCAEGWCHPLNHECTYAANFVQDCPAKTCHTSEGCVLSSGCQYQQVPTGTDCGDDKECDDGGNCIEEE